MMRCHPFRANQRNEGTESQPSPRRSERLNSPQLVNYSSTLSASPKSNSSLDKESNSGALKTPTKQFSEVCTIYDSPLERAAAAQSNKIITNFVSSGASAKNNANSDAVANKSTAINDITLAHCFHEEFDEEADDGGHWFGKKIAQKPSSKTNDQYPTEENDQICSMMIEKEQHLAGQTGASPLITAVVEDQQQKKQVREMFFDEDDGEEQEGGEDEENEQERVEDEQFEQQQNDERFLEVEGEEDDEVVVGAEENLEEGGGLEEDLGGQQQRMLNEHLLRLLYSQGNDSLIETSIRDDGTNRQQSIRQQQQLRQFLDAGDYVDVGGISNVTTNVADCEQNKGNKNKWVPFGRGGGGGAAGKKRRGRYQRARKCCHCFCGGFRRVGGPGKGGRRSGVGGVGGGGRNNGEMAAASAAWASAALVWAEAARAWALSC